MPEPMSTALFAARVGFFLTRYSSYAFNKRKQDDKSVRKWISTNLESYRSSIMEVMERAHRKDNKDLAYSMKRLLDEIDMFKNDSYLAETGVKGQFFSSKSAASSTSLDKLIEYDALIMEDITKGGKALEHLLKAMSAGENGIESSADDIVTHFISSRSKFRDRIKYIKGFGD